MPSKIDICNRALSLIGARSTIADFSEGSKEAQACALWYDELREGLLRAAHWGFSKKTAPLSELGRLTANTSPYPWPFKYTYPADCLKMRFLLPPTPPAFTGVVATASTPLAWLCASPLNRFEVANDTDNSGNMRRVLTSNLESAQAVYTVDVQNVSLFDPEFRLALTQLLAAHIVNGLTGKISLRNGLIQSAMDAVISARVSNANEAILNTTDHTPDWIAVRGDGAPLAGNFGWGVWYLGYENVDWS